MTYINEDHSLLGYGNVLIVKVHDISEETGASISGIVTGLP
jgi:hypothetical protein